MAPSGLGECFERGIGHQALGRGAPLEVGQKARANQDIEMESEPSRQYGSQRDWWPSIARFGSRLDRLDRGE
eukprot:15469370-Alexandrium_andersonii.AAC.1